MSILQARIARKFHVGQAGAAEIKLIGPNRVRGEKIVSTGRSYDVVLIYAVAANPDRTNQDAISIQRYAARENRDSVRQIQSDAIP